MVSNTVCQEGHGPDYVKGAFARIADKYALTNHVLSAGTDILWRRKVSRMVGRLNPESVLDVATGTGDLALQIQRHCPDVEVLGTDFCEEMLRHASARGLREVLKADALELPFEDESFDVATVGFGLRNMASWEGGLSEMSRVVRPGGVVLVLDFSIPQGILRRPYTFYLTRLLPMIAGAITGEREAYEYLAESIDCFPSGEAMLGLFSGAGLLKPEWTPLSAGIASIYTGQVPPTQS